jgi:hypothetical protein
MWRPPFILVPKFHFKISIVHFLHKVCYVCSLLQHYIISTNVIKTLGLFRHLRVDIVRLQLNCNDHNREINTEQLWQYTESEIHNSSKVRQ